uniref:Complement factor properdin n=1 Tax=Periophthalmus magnuspinnatus TaxID=409849 RepID=A0A3B4BBU5_9GOBI
MVGNAALVCRGLNDPCVLRCVCCCVADGEWSQWTPWGQCSVSCGAGLQSRYRTQSLVQGTISSAITTNTTVMLLVCPGDGGWGPWTNWTECSKSCGGGVRSRRRECDSPTPEGEGNYCEGLGTEVSACSTLHCPVAGGWCEWSDWTPCSRTCGAESVSRYRSCGCPEPKEGGATCPGAGVLLCDSVPGCHVDGGWSQWSPWAECSMSCGGGVKSRTRLCNNPAPQSGGRGCLGVAEQRKECNIHIYCPVDGGWSRWSPWSRCDKHCGGGRSIRTRSCSSPPPKNGGKKCEGEKNQVKPCNTKPCVNGGWTPWSEWSDCSVTCGRGSQVRSRACINPPPRNNGSDCSGPDRDSQECHKPPCLSVFSFFFKIYTVLSSIW